MDFKINQSIECLNDCNKELSGLLQLQNRLDRHKDLYDEIIDYLNGTCEQCKIMEELNLPYDCITNPSYCIRKPLYYSFIEIYDSLQDKLIEIQN